MIELGNILDRAISLGTGIIGRWKLYAGIAALAVLACSLSYCKGRSDGVAIERAAQAKAERKQAEKARKADAEARKAQDATVDAIEAENDRAREAAQGSDDPLKAALDVLE